MDGCMQTLLLTAGIIFDDWRKTNWHIQRAFFSSPRSLRQKSTIDLLKFNYEFMASLPLANARFGQVDLPLERTMWHRRWIEVGPHRSMCGFVRSCRARLWNAVSLNIMFCLATYTAVKTETFLTKRLSNGFIVAVQWRTCAGVSSLCTPMGACFFYRIDWPDCQAPVANVDWLPICSSVLITNECRK